MANERNVWRSGELLAYTDRDGPGRPPAASPTWMMGTLIGVLGVTFVGMLSADTLCPDHRVWVQTLASLAFLGVLVAFVGLIRGWAAAPLVTLASSSMGVAIGLLDAVHSPTRGRLIAVGFAIVTALAAAATWKVVLLRRWDRTTTAAMRSAIVDDDIEAELPVRPVERDPRAEPVAVRSDEETSTIGT